MLYFTKPSCRIAKATASPTHIRICSGLPYAA